MLRMQNLVPLLADLLLQHGGKTEAATEDTVCIVNKGTQAAHRVIGLMGPLPQLQLQCKLVEVVANMTSNDKDIAYVGAHVVPVTSAMLVDYAQESMDRYMPRLNLGNVPHLKPYFIICGRLFCNASDNCLIWHALWFSVVCSS